MCPFVNFSDLAIPVRKFLVCTDQFFYWILRFGAVETGTDSIVWTIQKTNGEVLSGLLVDDAVPDEQTYVDSKGELFRVKTSEIERKKPQQTSIMPDDITKTMTIQEVRDLLAFLLAPR